MSRYARRYTTIIPVAWLIRANSRAQVSQRLKERGFDATGDEAYHAACYAAKVRRVAHDVGHSCIPRHVICLCLPERPQHPHEVWVCWRFESVVPSDCLWTYKAYLSDRVVNTYCDAAFQALPFQRRAVAAFIKACWPGSRADHHQQPRGAVQQRDGHNALAVGVRADHRGVGRAGAVDDAARPARRAAI